MNRMIVVNLLHLIYLENEKLMKILKVKGNTYCIDSGMTYIPFYKIGDTEIIMLDSGWATGERAGITQLFETNNLSVVGIINTHSHIDHSGNNAFLKAEYNCTIAMSEVEAHISIITPDENHCKKMED
jgi:glyoxylase-like metal-dependent hydrolase (beta-lactamase superfamily II)